MIPDGFAWPDGCMDLPGNGVMCRKGQPICSIIAHQKQAYSVMDALLTQQLNLIKGLHPHGI
jgi:methenyltetrahydromethanopterin cyclohydrolase